MDRTEAWKSKWKPMALVSQRDRNLSEEVLGFDLIGLPLGSTPTHFFRLKRIPLYRRVWNRVLAWFGR